MDRYACPEIDALFTTEAQYARWLRVEATASAATGHPLVSDGWIEWRSFVERCLSREQEYGHDVAAFVEVLREHEADHDIDAARWLHYGLCSSDVVDAGWLLAFRDVTEVLHEKAQMAVEAVGTFGNTQSSTATVYRTHGQAAQVSAGDHRWQGLWNSLLHVDRWLGQTLPDTIGFDGPTGNGGEFTFEQRCRVGGVLGLDTHSGHTGQQAQRRDRWVVWLRTVADLATWCERFGTQVRLLAQTGVDELREGRGADYRGSSSMPHKQNPTRSERLCGLAPVVRGLVAGYAEAAASCWDSHSLEHSSAERVVIPQVTSLVGFMLTEVTEIARSLVVNAENVEHNALVAPGDSYAAKNALVRDGVDGGTAWVQSRADAEAVVRHTLTPLGMTQEQLDSLRDAVSGDETPRSAIIERSGWPTYDL